MLVSLIAALTSERIIGKDNALPWHLPADLKHFKQLTLGKPIVMGRKTFESVGHPLPGRHNVIVTHQRDYHVPHCTVVHSLQAAFDTLQATPEIFVIGGAEIYRQALPFADQMYLTLINAAIPGNIYFPIWQAAEWEQVSEICVEADSQNPYAYRFLLLKRKKTRI